MSNERSGRRDGIQRDENYLSGDDSDSEDADMSMEEVEAERSAGELEDIVRQEEVILIEASDSDNEGSDGIGRATVDVSSQNVGGVALAIPQPGAEITIDASSNAELVTLPLLEQHEEEEKGAHSTSSMRKKENTVEDEDAEEDWCPICYEPWTISGLHRLVSLNCGHLFGKSCIDKWLQSSNNKKCPQCNRRAKRKDIRHIYAKKIQALDTSERDRALKDLETERQRRNRAEEAEARAIFQVQVAQEQLRQLRSQLEKERRQWEERLQRVTRENVSSALFGSQEAATPGLSSPRKGNALTACKDILGIPGQYVTECVIQVAKDSARVMTWEPVNRFFAVSKASMNQVLAPGYGVVKISGLNMKPGGYIPIHRGVIRDCCFNNSGDQLLLSAAMDKQLIVTNVQSNTAVVKYACPAPIWSCCWNYDDTNYVFAGLGNGTVHAYDLRRTDAELVIIRDGGTTCPVNALSYVPEGRGTMFTAKGLLMGTLRGGSFLEKITEARYIAHPLDFSEGNNTCLSFDRESRYCLLSQRPSKNCNKTRHLVCELTGQGVAPLLSSQTSEIPVAQGNDICKVSVACTAQALTGGSKSTLLTRSVIYRHSDAYPLTMVAAGDEESKSTIVWDATRGHEVQRLVSPGGPVLDVLPCNNHDASFLAALTEKTLQLNRWKNS